MRALISLLAGLLISLGLGLTGAGHLDPIADHGLFAHVCDVALAVAVFSSGLAVERTIPRSSYRLVALLLIVGMPLTIAAVAVLGSATLGLGLGAAVLLGAVLTPTDPVLAGEVGLGAPGDPELGEPRLSLHTEAGANDGLAAPLVAVGLLIVDRGGHGWIGHWLAVDLVYRVGGALVIGMLAGALVAAGLSAGRARERHLRNPVTLAALAIAAGLGIAALAAALHTATLVAVFVAGITCRRRERDDAVHQAVHEGFERVSAVLEVVVIALLGASLTTAGIAAAGLGAFVVATGLLLVVRPLTVLAVCVGTPLNLRERLYLGWFGVRGVAALYYAALLASTGALSVHATRTVVWATVVCIAVSIIVHGLSARPLMRRWLAAPEC